MSFGDLVVYIVDTQNHATYILLEYIVYNTHIRLVKAPWPKRPSRMVAPWPERPGWTLVVAARQEVRGWW